MVEVKITEKALNDLSAIGEFIARDSEKYAKATIQNIFETFKYLEDFPELGRIVPEINNKSIREVILGNYRIIYWILSKKRIDIIAIHHSANILTKRHIKRRRKD